MKKIIFILLIISWGFIVGGFQIRNSLVEMLLPYIEFNRELHKSVSGIIKDITEINRLREENFLIKNREFIYVNKDFKERIEELNLNEIDKLKRVVEGDNFFRGRSFEISSIVYLDKSNSRLFVSKIGDFGPGDSVLIGRFYLGKIVSVTNLLYEVELWNKRDTVINSFILTQNSGQLVMNIRSENFNTSFIDNILSTEDVRVGDVVVTSATNEGIPKNLFIGTIDRVEGVSSQTFRKALIKKDYDLEKSNYVLILKK